MHRQIIVDGTYFNGWCVLIAFDGTYVLGWQWCDRESSTAWVQLLKRFPAPEVVVADGGTGLQAALDRQWKTTRIQRCFFHVHAAVRRHTTWKPKLTAGQEILGLTRDLMEVRDLDAAAAWMGAYASWEAKWAQFLAHRTYLKKGVDRPSWAKRNTRWWYTHIRLRRVRKLYRSLIRDDALFTWLDDAYCQDDVRTVSRTTSALEGGPNRAVKELLRHHRGLSEDHARIAVDWLLNSLTEHPHDPWKLAKDHLQTSTKPPQTAGTEDQLLGPETYGTAATAEEGLYARKGWAGRR